MLNFPGVALTNLDCLIELGRNRAEVAELADALRSGRSRHYACEGSNPSSGTQKPVDSIPRVLSCLVFQNSVIYGYGKKTQRY
jgi:hypothetical protein